ncbi:glycoside hydrolase [Aspergillus oleicola]
MHIYNEIDGSVFYNFQYINALFDSMLELGVRPFVQFGSCPSQFATTLGTTFWWKGNGSPPRDMQKWVDLVRAFVQHCVGRYGIEEIEQWYFEVWNEPNLGGFWAGTRMQYFELYEATVKTVKNIASCLCVGGPSTSNFVPDDRFAGEKEDLDARSI